MIKLVLSVRWRENSDRIKRFSMVSFCPFVIVNMCFTKKIALSIRPYVCRWAMKLTMVTIKLVWLIMIIPVTKHLSVLAWCFVTGMWMMIMLLLLRLSSVRQQTIYLSFVWWPWHILSVAADVTQTYKWHCLAIILFVRGLGVEKAFL